MVEPQQVKVGRLIKHPIKLPLRGKPHRIVHEAGRRGTVSVDAGPDGPLLIVCGERRHLPRRLADFLKREAKKDIERLVAKHCATVGRRATATSVIPRAMSPPMSCGRSACPASNSTWPSLTSSPMPTTFSPGATGRSTSMVVASRRWVCSTGTTASAPAGSGAPVMIRRAVPAGTSAATPPAPARVGPVSLRRGTGAYDRWCFRRSFCGPLRFCGRAGRAGCAFLGGGQPVNLEELFVLAQKNNVQLWLEQGQLRYRAPRESLSDELLSAMRGQREQLARALGRGRRTSTALFPLSCNQQSLWMLHQLAPESAAYNVAAACRIRGRLDRQAMIKGLEAVTGRHQSLRTTYDFWPDGAGPCPRRDPPLQEENHDNHQDHPPHRRRRRSTLLNLRLNRNQLLPLLLDELHQFLRTAIGDRQRVELLARQRWRLRQ